MDKANITIGLINIGTAVLMTGISIPLIKEKVGMNRWYGFRIPKAFESDEQWFRINKLGGKLLLYYSIPLAMLGVVCLFLPELDQRAVITLASAPLIYVIATLHALLLSLKL